MSMKKKLKKKSFFFVFSFDKHDTYKKVYLDQNEEINKYCEKNKKKKCFDGFCVTSLPQMLQFRKKGLILK